jgi:hypothetical protein
VNTDTAVLTYLTHYRQHRALIDDYDAMISRAQTAISRARGRPPEPLAYLSELFSDAAWPTGAQVMGAIVRLNESHRAMVAAWEAIPVECRSGLRRPPEQALLHD